MSKEEKEVILDFIKRRFQKDCHWCDGNCYWFAKILTERFRGLDVWYLPIQNHFIAGADETYFDWTGEVIPDEKPMYWDMFDFYDELLYKRIVRDCVL